MKNTLKLSHAKREIVMDATFAKLAENTMSAEYAHLQQVRKDYPTYTVTKRQIKRNANKESYAALLRKLFAVSSPATFTRAEAPISATSSSLL